MFHCQLPADGQQQQGFTIVEALVAFFILVAGLLALLSFHGTAQRNSAEARIQAEAAALAEQKLNELASFLRAGDARLSPSGVGACPGEVSSGSGITNFVFSCEISGANPREVRVVVTWRDRDDQLRQAVASSKIRLAEPSQDAAGLLTLVRAAISADQSEMLWPAVETGDLEDGQDGENGSNDEDSSEESPGSDGDEPENPDDSEPPQPLTLHTRIISGAAVANSAEESPPEIVSVIAHSPPPSISAHCSRPTTTSFRCTVTYADPRVGWSGTILLTAQGNQRLHSGTECGSTVTLSFTAVTQNIDDVSLSAC